MFSAPPMFVAPSQPTGYAMPPARPYQRAATAPSLAAAPRSEPLPRTVRGQIGDEPAPSTGARERPAPLAMPSPGDLGIGIAKAEEPPVDWNLVDQRLRKFGAVSIHRQRLTQG